MIDFDVSIISVFIIIWIILVLVMKIKYNKDLIYVVFFTLFYIYLCNVVKYTQFPIIVDEFMKEQIGQNIFREANCIPLITLTNSDVISSVLNIILTIPFGFGLPFLKKIRGTRIIVLGILLSLSIESMQLIIALTAGFSMRYLDINDIIFNTLGVIIGLFVYKIFRNIVEKLIENKLIQTNKILEFLTE